MCLESELSYESLEYKKVWKNSAWILHLGQKMKNSFFNNTPARAIRGFFLYYQKMRKGKFFQLVRVRFKQVSEVIIIKIVIIVFSFIGTKYIDILIKLQKQSSFSVTIVLRTYQISYNLKDLLVFQAYRIPVEGWVFWTKNFLEWLVLKGFEKYYTIFHNKPYHYQLWLNGISNNNTLDGYKDLLKWRMRK